MHKNHSIVLYLQYQHRVEKLEEFIDWARSYTRLKFREIAVFVSKCSTRYISTTTTTARYFFRLSLSDNNFGSIIDGKMFFTAFDRYLLDLS